MVVWKFYYLIMVVSTVIGLLVRFSQEQFVLSCMLTILKDFFSLHVSSYSSDPVGY